MTLGLLVFLLGTALAYSVLLEQEQQKMLVLQQQQRVSSILGKLTEGITDVYFFRDINTSEKCQQQLGIYNQRRADRMCFFTAAITLMMVGIIITACSFSLWLTNVIANVIFICIKPLISPCLWLKNKIPFLQIQHHAPKNSKVIADSGWHYVDTKTLNPSQPSTLKMNYSKHDLITSALCAKNSEKFSVMLSDEKTSQLAKPNPAAVAVLESPQNPQQDTKKSLQSATSKAEPVHDTLKNLAEQVSAIRQYAANQQEKVTKLQEGYDWNITRTFCLRIIRCIDNIETRISELEEDETDSGDLEQIKDELIFALESSGVEQFEPKINSDYIGQEKFVEAAKEKQQCCDLELKGKIAKVLRPGYQYIIDEENVKVVRTAQVRLFGESNK